MYSNFQLQKILKGAVMRAVGIAILVVGIVILGFGLNSALTITEKVVEGVSGRYTSNTMWYIIGGIALIVLGGASAYLSNKK